MADWLPLLFTHNIKEDQMLVLSRRVGESLMIGDIEVKVIRVQGGQVRLAINAPRSVPVHRKEVAQRIEAGKLETCSTLSIN